MKNIKRAEKANDLLKQALRELRAFQMTNEQVSSIAEEMEGTLEEINREVETLKV